MRYHLFQKFFGKMVKIKETSFLSTRGMTLMFGNCIPTPKQNHLECMKVGKLQKYHIAQDTFHARKVVI